MFRKDGYKLGLREPLYVIKNKKLTWPGVTLDGLELYYDTKGKKNTDLHKDTLIDMSGNGRHGKLHNFNYKNLSGYQEDSELVFDGIDDKLVLSDVEKPEIISATKNLFDGLMEEGYYHPNTGTKIVSENHARSKSFLYVKKGTPYTLTKDISRNGYIFYYNSNKELISAEQIVGLLVWQFATPANCIYIKFHVDDTNLSANYSVFQLEEGSTATPYVPYIPSTRGTYQLNNNVISYNRDTVSWVKDGKVMERKGINLLKNSITKDGEWWRIAGNGTYHNGEIVVTSLASSHLEVSQMVDVIEGHTYFIYVEMRSNSSLDNVSLMNGDSTFYHSGSNKYEKIIGLSTARVTNTTELRILQSRREGNISDSPVKLRKPMLIDLTATFGAGDEPTLEEIQAEPDKWQWLPNPMDLIEAKELKGNILGDMEDIIDDHTRDEQSGVEVFTDKADDSLVRVEVDGKSYQHAGSGKNLLPHPEQWTFSGGATLSSEGVVTIPNGGRITVNYYWDGDTDTQMYGFEVLEGKGRLVNTQYFDVNGRPAVNTGGDHSANGNGINELLLGEHAFGMPQLDSSIHRVNISIMVTSQFGGDNTLKIRNLWGGNSNKIQAYEPPIPTPDYPIEIHSLNDFDVVSQKSEGGKIDGIEVGGRNLIRNSNFQRGVAGYGIWGNSSISVNTEGNLIINYSSGGNSTQGVQWNQSVSDSGDYVFSAKVRPSNAEAFNPASWPTLRMQYAGASPSNQFYPMWSDSGDGWYLLEANVKINAADATFYFYGWRDLGANETLEIKWFQLEKGNKATDWTPAPEDIKENDNHPLIDKINLLLSEPLRSVGDVKDRLFRDGDGLWKVERNVGSVVLTGEETFQPSSTFVKVIIPKKGINTGLNRTDYAMSSHYKSVINNISAFLKNTFTISGTGDIAFGMNYEPSPTTEEFKKTIEEQRPTFIYELATPTIETLSNDLQTKLNNISSFAKGNYVYTVGNKKDALPSHISENLKPMIHTEFLAKDHFKESRTVNNLLIWNRALKDDELLNQNKLFHERFNMRSETIKGEPINQTVNLLNGGLFGHSLEQNYTIEI